MMSARGIAIICALPLGLFCTAGCYIPYAYPNLSYVPGPDFVLPDSRAFRVDVTLHELADRESGEFTLTEIPRAIEEIPPQIGFSVDHGYFVAAPGLSHNLGWLHSTRIRVYTPGYPLVEVCPWDMSKIEAVDASRQLLNWSGQETAIDDLIRCPVVSSAFLEPSTHHGNVQGKGKASPPISTHPRRCSPSRRTNTTGSPHWRPRLPRPSASGRRRTSCGRCSASRERMMPICWGCRRHLATSITTCRVANPPPSSLANVPLVVGSG